MVRVCAECRVALGRHNEEHAKHEGVARELECAREDFREFERKDIKVSQPTAMMLPQAAPLQLCLNEATDWCADCFHDNIAQQCYWWQIVHEQDCMSSCSRDPSLHIQ